jgi:hypothetical protein
MLRKEETKLELKRDEDRANKFTEMVESLRGKILGTLTERCEVLQKRLQALLTSKRELLEAPCSKQEILAEAKSALRKYRQQFGIERFIVENLKKSMLNGGAFPLRPDHLKETIFRNESWPEIMIFSMITDEMVEKVVGAIPEPEGALSLNGRTKWLKKLDEDIEKLELLLAKESAAVASTTAKAMEED